MEKNKNNSIKLALKNEKPEFIDDISSILDCLNNKIKIKFMNIKLLEYLYDKDILKDHNQISFWSGNNKIIIEFKDRQDIFLFIVNPLENISKIMLFSTLNKFNLANGKYQLYKELLSKKQLDVNEIYKKYNKIITNIKDYSDIYSSQINKENIQSKNDINNMDIKYKKDQKNNLNKSIEYNQNYSLMNDDKINKKDDINQLKLKIKDLKKEIEEKIKIIEELEIDKKKYYKKYNEYKDKYNEYKDKYNEYKDKIQKLEKNKNIINIEKKN